MLEYCAAITRGGIVLWKYDSGRSFGPDHPVDELIRSVLINEHVSAPDLVLGPYCLKWTLANKEGLIFVAVYMKVYPVTYVPELLARIRTAFARKLAAVPLQASGHVAAVDFDATFQRMHDAIQDEYDNRKRNRQTTGTSWQEEDGEGEQHQHQQHQQADSSDEGDEVGTTPRAADEVGADDAAAVALAPAEEDGANDNNDDNGVEKDAGDDAGDSAPLDAKALAKQKAREAAAKRSKRGGGKAPGGASAAVKSPPPRKPPVKVLRDRKLTKAEQAARAAELSRATDPQEGPSARPEEQVQIDVVAGGRRLDNLDDDDGDDDGHGDGAGAAADAGAGASSGGSSRVWSFFQSLTGNKIVTAEDMQPVNAALMQHLQEKNVAADVAAKLCESVGANLIGHKLPSLTSVRAAAQQALEQALTRILTPTVEIDVLRDVQRARDEARPYSIVMMGVNGVGKSTSLSKICYWLRQNGHSVLIAACDTFRAGAVEQLQTHARRLGVEVFEQGYGGDAAEIARAAIRKAKKEGTNCVLVDTAGRMQDNEPLMRSLAKVITVNEPDLILFVGEALVGNDGVDQLCTFNRCLVDYSDPAPGREPRSIDGVVLSKFDTVDNKVGAAISMVYASGAPILFVGTGQNYTDLKNLNASAVVKALMR